MITQQELLHIAKLAKLRIPEAKIEKFQTDLTQILDFFQNLEEVNTDNVPETSQVTGLENITRPDVVEMSQIEEDLVNCTPHTVENNAVKIPKIM